MNQDSVESFDLEVLKRMALNHFFDALRAGRLVAFTGSYANLQYGYPSWTKLIETHFENLEQLSGLKKDSETYKEFEKLKADTEADSEVDLVEYLADLSKDEEVYKKFETLRQQLTDEANALPATSVAGLDEYLKYLKNNNKPNKKSEKTEKKTLGENPIKLANSNVDLVEYLNNLKNNAEIYEKFKKLKAKTLDKKDPLSADSGVDLAEYLTGFDRYSEDKDNYKNLREKTLEMFRLTDIPNISDLPNIYSILFDKLHIKRFMTLNYDLEMEWHGFVDDHEKTTGKTRDEIWNGDEAGDEKIKGIVERSKRKKDLKTTLNRYMPGQGRITSQVLIRRHCETLFEFGLWSPDNETRILHMHGRQDHWDRILLSRRDYRDLYWRQGYTRLPFERGLQAIFGGNSVLFIGLGLGEAEVMRALEQFMSDNPSRVKSPHFVVWNSNFDKTGDIDVHANDTFRLEVYRKFGIHVLFDAELAELQGIDAKTYMCDIGIEAVGSIQAYKGIAYKGVSTEKEPNFEPKKNTEPVNEFKTLCSSWRLERTLDSLFEFSDRLWRATPWNHKTLFRSMKDKYENNGDKLIQIWGVDSPITKMQASSRKTPNPKVVIAQKTDSDILKPLKTPVLDKCHSIILMPMSPGSGKGKIASALAGHFSETVSCRTFLINAEFVNETDSIFEALSGAVSGKVALEAEKSRNNGFERVYGRNRANISSDHDPFVVIFNGMERFIGKSGKPLCSEFDSVIRKCVRHFDTQKKHENNSHLIFLGTGRMGRYLSTLTKNITMINVEPEPKRKADSTNEDIFKIEKDTLTFKGKADDSEEYEVSIQWPQDTPRLSYFDEIRKAHEDLKLKNLEIKSPPRRLALTEQRLVFFRQILTTDHFSKVFSTPGLKSLDINPNLPLAILRTLAFIGQPVPQSVLLRCSEVRKHLSMDREKQKNEFKSILERLSELKLLIQMEKLNAQPKDDIRYGLHNAMLAELRVRYGIPLTDSKLACSFNLSIYAAQSSDGYIPEPYWHKHLGKLARDLTTAYRMDERQSDSQNPADLPGKFDLAEARKRLRKYGYIGYTDPDLRNMLKPECAASLRAALSLMRNYYSTGALLMHSNHDIDPTLKKAPLTEHLLRLKRLIRISRDIAIIRDYARECINDENISEDKRTEKILAMGQEAFFPDDLVWLNNELGIVHLTQGKLYGAKFAFEKALKINDTYVEYGEKLRNWRTISLNLVQLQIDRGRLEKARATLQSLETAIEDHAKRFGNFPTELTASQDEDSILTRKRARDIIIERYARDPSGANYNRIDREFPTDIMLSVALCLCYRGLIKLLMGAYAASVDNFEDGLQILKALDEQRAYSMFKKHYASVLGSLGRKTDSHTALRESVAAAGNTKQTDLDHHARIAIVRYGYNLENLQESKSESGQIPQLMQSLNYSNNSDMFRVQLEALQTLAWIHYSNDDYDSSIRYAADAIAVASKYGHGLRKVTLRTLVAIILIRRGNRESAIKMLKQASRIATKIRFDKAVEQVENVMVEISERH